MVDHNKKASESYQKWYKMQSWYAKLFIILFRLRECYEGAYCDGWMDCSEYKGTLMQDLQDLSDAIEEIKVEGGMSGLAKLTKEIAEKNHRDWILLHAPNMN